MDELVNEHEITDKSTFGVVKGAVPGTEYNVKVRLMVKYRLICFICVCQCNILFLISTNNLCVLCFRILFKKT